ncbi:MAG: hypothetical protein PVI86_05865 [Phycisphaerae bacterium]|jgi:hypothetical protein
MGTTLHPAAEGTDKKEKQCFFCKTNPKIRTGAIENAVARGFVPRQDARIFTAPLRPNATHRDEARARLHTRREPLY